MDRTQQALTLLGVSIMAGANTTNLAGVWLWLGTMVFFNKFAFLINMTICSSVLWSLVFFPCAPPLMLF
jgi:protein dispatched 1